MNKKIENINYINFRINCNIHNEKSKIKNTNKKCNKIRSLQASR